MKEARTSKKLKEKEELLSLPKEEGTTGGEETKDGQQEEETKAEETKDKDDKGDDETIDDRVFVCMGKTTDGTDKRQIWVMTISRDLEEVIFWEVKNHKHWVLKGRIDPKEKKFMKEYFSPVISKEERELIEKNRSHRLATSMAESMANMEDFQPKKGGEVEESGSEDNAEKSDDEGEEDSHFTNDIEKIINYSDMD